MRCDYKNRQPSCQLKSLPTIAAPVGLPASQRCCASHAYPKTGFHLTLQMIFLYKYYDLEYLASPGHNIRKIPEHFAGTAPGAIDRG